MITNEWAVPAYLYLSIISVMLAYIDFTTKRLPNKIVLPAYPVMAGLLLLPAVFDGAWGAYVSALIGSAALFGVYLLLALINPRGMGMGDVKLAGVLGMGLGWFGMDTLLVGTVLGFLIGAAVGVIALVTRKADRHATIPFGPAMIVGAWVGILVGA